VKKYTLFFLISIFLVILQQAVFSRISIFGAAFDVVFVYIVCFSIVRDNIEGLIIALFTGIIRDCFFPAAFGINTVVFIITAFSIGYLEKRIYKDTIIVPVIFTFFATITKGLLYFSYFYIISYKFDFIKNVIYIVVLESIINCIISIYIYKLILKVYSMGIFKNEWKF
jgi:rod shape-determining protein MreD